MAKKKTIGASKMPVAAEPELRHIQVQLPAEPYELGKVIARNNGLSMAAYVRQAILQRIRDDAKEGGEK
jgi:hypothetical protein